MRNLIRTKVQNNPLNYIDPDGKFEVHREAGVPLNLGFALRYWRKLSGDANIFYVQKNEMM